MKPTLQELEEASLAAVALHCPLCGVIGKQNFCKSCNFKWGNNKLYISNTNPTISWDSEANSPKE